MEQSSRLDTPKQDSTIINNNNRTDGMGIYAASAPQSSIIHGIINQCKSQTLSRTSTTSTNSSLFGGLDRGFSVRTRMPVRCLVQNAHRSHRLSSSPVVNPTDSRMVSCMVPYQHATSKKITKKKKCRKC